jgi:hypothetical protein
MLLRIPSEYMTIDICWICHEHPADSGEHVPKESDIAQLFGKNARLLKHVSGARARLVQAPSSREFHSVRICRLCNNTRSQPYDEAWRTLSKYLDRNWSTIRHSRRIDLGRVFPGATRRGREDLHLFFVKLTGCRALEAQMPIDLTPLSRALMRREACPLVYLAVGETVGRVNFDVAGPSHIHARSDPLFPEIPQVFVWFRVGSDRSPFATAFGRTAMTSGSVHSGIGTHQPQENS